MKTKCAALGGNEGTNSTFEFYCLQFYASWFLEKLLNNDSTVQQNIIITIKDSTLAKKKTQVIPYYVRPDNFNTSL